MKKYIIAFVFFIFSAVTFGQIFVHNFESDQSTNQIAQKLTTELNRILSQRFYLIAQSKDVASMKKAKEVFSEYIEDNKFKNLDIPFVMLSGSVRQSKDYSVFFDLQFKVISESKIEIVNISERYFKEENISEISELLSKIVFAKVKAFAKSDIINSEFLRIPLKFEKSDSKGITIDCYSITGKLLGNAEIDKFSESQITLEVDRNTRKKIEAGEESIVVLFQNSNSLSENSMSSLKKLREAEPTELSSEQREFEIQQNRDSLEAKKNHAAFEKNMTEIALRDESWISASIESFSTKDQFWANSFSQQAITIPSPAILRIKIALNKNDLHWIVNGRISTKKSFDQLGSKFNFFEAGLGIENTYYIYKVIQPSMGITVNYARMYFTTTGGSSNYQGLNIDAHGALGIKVKSLGVFGEIGLKNYPWLKEMDGTSRPISFLVYYGIGISLFF